MTYAPQYIAPLSEAIGRVIVEWNRIEHVVAELAHRLAGCLNVGAISDPHDVVRIALMNMELKSRLATVRAYALAGAVDDVFYKEIDQVLKTVDQMREQRNRYVHSLWFCDDGQPVRVKIRSTIKASKSGGSVHSLYEQESYISIRDLAKFGAELAQKYVELSAIEGRVSLSQAYQSNLIRAKKLKLKK